ncbi:MAG: 6-phosphofructokinase, partial [Anaerolineales bacterium]
ALLTGGGDVPGLNMCLKSLVYRLSDLGFIPIGVRKGWEGFINYNPHDPTTYSDNFIELTKNIVRPIDRTPGSFLHSSRIEPREMPSQSVPSFLHQEKLGNIDLTDHIMDIVERLELRALIAIGDDDMLHYAAHLNQKGVPIIAIPKTIHNNIHGTDYSLGFSTGLARGVSFVHELRALAGSREQLIVVETFAAKSGYSTLLIALLSGADRVIIPEVPYNPERLAGLALQDKHETPANYAVIVVCDGSNMDAESFEKYHDFLSRKTHSGSGMEIADLLQQITAEEVFLQPLTYLLRTGFPDGQDLLGAANFAFLAARLVNEERYGRMAAFIQEKMWTDVDLNLATEGVKTVDVENWYDPENYKPNLSLIWSIENN